MGAVTKLRHQNLVNIYGAVLDPVPLLGALVPACMFATTPVSSQTDCCFALYDSLAPLTKWGAVMELMGNRSLHDVLYNGTCVMDGEMIGNIIQDIVSG